jgi:two-component system, NtrC family, sensor kinase
MKKFFLTAFIICSLQCYAQNKTIDSLSIVLQSAKEDTGKVKILNWLAYLFRSNDPDTAIYFANTAIALATRINDETGIINAYLYKGIATKNLGNFEEALKNNRYALSVCDQLLASDKKIDRSAILKLKAGTYSGMGNIYEEQGNYTEALENNLAALKIRQETGDKAGLAASYNNIGNIYGDQGNYPEALKNHFAALKIKEETGDKKSIGNSYNNIGSLYYNHRDYDQALKYHAAALKLRQEIGDKSGIASSYNNIGIVYDDKGDHTQALKYHFASLKIAEEIGDKQGIALSYSNIGLVSLHRGDNTEALKYFQVYLKISEEIEDTGSITDAYINIGNVNIKMKNNDAASIYLNKGLVLAKEIGSIDFIKECYNALAMLDSAQANFKQALGHYKLYIIYRDSLFNKENTKKLVQSQMQYEFDKKESLAKAEQDKKDAEAKRVKNIQYFTIAALGIIVLSVLVVALIQYRHNKQKQKANLLLTEQKEKVEAALSELKSTQSQLIQSEKMASLGELTAGIAHEIQNPLNFVNNFSEVNAELIDEANQEVAKGNIAELKNILNDIKDNAQKINHHGKRADAIVKGMLQHSRSSSGVKEPTNINALADEYLRLAYHGLRAKDKSFNATMKTDFDESIGAINIIPQDIGRVILNLINNAFYAASQPSRDKIGRGLSESDGNKTPTVWVNTKKAGDKVLISVGDNGPGIPQKILDKIFQPFFTTKPTGQGTGLGLSLSYDIVKAHGGELKVETKEGEYAEFIIQLPG